MKKKDPFLVIYSDKSVLNESDGSVHEFLEGKLSATARNRANKIKQELNNGYLEKIIKECHNPANLIYIDEEHAMLIDNLVASITSEVGRAVVGLTLLQLTIKSIDNDQSIRLHKGSTSNGTFSWSEGISMRTIDKNYITPILRKYDLLRLNADGIMMTRSFAENYPYSKLYKAAIRGNKEGWITIVDLIENQHLDATNGLKYLIVQLIQKSNNFKELSNKLIEIGRLYIQTNTPNFDNCFKLIIEFVNNSTYSARIFEISMHAFFQTLDNLHLLEGFLIPLSQMRSANKKHGNIGDIEVSLSKKGNDIVESWDAKFGKSYLRDELEELNEKLDNHSSAKLVGFVTDSEPNLKEEISGRISELEVKHDVNIKIMSFYDWVNFQIQRYDLAPDKFGQLWILNIIDTITLNKKEMAPIDEPTNLWVEEFINLIS